MPPDSSLNKKQLRKLQKPPDSSLSKKQLRMPLKKLRKCESRQKP